MGKAIQKTETAISSPNQLLEMAVSKDLDMEKLERLIQLQVQHEERQAFKIFHESMAAFQKECPIIKKEDKVDFTTAKGTTRYNFAGFDSIILQVRDLIASHGFSYRFEYQTDSNKIRVGCVVTHKDGHSESTWMEGVADSSGNKNSLQQSGSTFTYLKRYTFLGAFGIVTSDKDDDGKASQPKVTDDLVQLEHNKYMKVLNEALNVIDKKEIPKSYFPDNWKNAFKDRNPHMYQAASQRLTALVNKKLDQAA